MKTMVDLRCSQGHLTRDAWMELGGERPECVCGCPTVRADAPAINPQGKTADREQDTPSIARVDTKAIAEEVTLEVAQRRATYATEALADEGVMREINHKAGIADELGNEIPIPKPAPIVCERGKDLAA